MLESSLSFCQTALKISFLGTGAPCALKSNSKISNSLFVKYITFPEKLALWVSRDNFIFTCSVCVGAFISFSRFKNDKNSSIKTGRLKRQILCGFSAIKPLTSGVTRWDEISAVRSHSEFKKRISSYSSISPLITSALTTAKHSFSFLTEV